MTAQTLLAQHMKDEGLTQKAVAEALGIRQPVVAAWLATKGKPHSTPIPVGKAVALEEIYGWDAYELLLSDRIAEIRAQLEALGHAPPDATKAS